MLRLVPDAGHALGVHLDRDEVRAVLVDLTGRIVAERRTAVDLARSGAEAAVDAVLREAEPLAERASAGTLLGAGVALPGPLDHARGVLHRVTGFPQWEGFPLRETLAGRMGVAVVVDKDTNAAALGLAVAGERDGRAGAGPVGSFAYLHLGTGLGAGLVIGGVVHRGGADRGGGVRAPGHPVGRAAVHLR
ncbi:hypothetical protein GCM10020256_48830 [Streptomyces thermocoprophilus]